MGTEKQEQENKKGKDRVGQEKYVGKREKERGEVWGKYFYVIAQGGMVN